MAGCVARPILTFDATWRNNKTLLHRPARRQNESETETSFVSGVYLETSSFVQRSLVEKFFTAKLSYATDWKMLPQDRKILRQHTRQNQNQNPNATAVSRRSRYNGAYQHSKMNSSSKADPISLSFHDSCLRMSDVQLLHGPHWLNDQILSFYYEYLSHVKYKTNDDLHFIAPEVTQCMKYMDEQELELLLGQSQATTKPFIFFALNDNESTEAGGTHWSLLVFSRPEKTFYHFDSYGNNNTSNSVELMNKIKELLGQRQAKFRPMRCLQQANGYDCGIHVICMTDHIADYLNRYEMIDGLPPLHVDAVKAKRTELLKLILSLGGKG